MNSRFKALRKFVILALAASLLTLIGLFAYSFSTQREELLTSLARLDPLVVLIAIGLHLGALCMWGVRMSLLADGAGYPLGVVKSVEAVFAGVFVAALTPARVGGEPVRFGALTANGTPPREASLIVLLERALDVLVFVVLCLWASIVLIPKLPQSALFTIGVPIGLVVLLLVIVVPVLVLHKPRLLHPFIQLGGRFVRAERAERAKEWVVLEAVRVRRALAVTLSNKPSRVPLAILATGASWTLEFGVFYHLLGAFGHDVPYIAVALGLTLVMLLTTLPLLPGGSGIAEVGALGVFAPMAPGLTPTVVLVWRVTTYYMDVVLGGVFAVRFAGSETMRVLTGRKRQPDVARVVVEGKDG